ncbi:MAG TPA: hypothetical protein VHZ26_12380 [Caulobacteraceae bacterium]|jgi:hypothetical protein|nr:hypothetical protein [Caulobacteraceae bacterium]
MPSAPTRRFRPWLGALAALGGLVAPALAQATAVDAFYERAVMTAADQRCRLFSPELGSALQAAEAQARGAALRSGYNSTTLSQVEQRADAKIASLPCGSPDIATAATRVRAAFDGYAKLQRMSYPGDLAGWTADRSTSRRVAIWKLSQADQFGGGRLVFGLAGGDGPSALVAVASFPDGAQPYAARLVMRDASLAPEAFINMIQAGAGKAPLSARTPPRSATRAFMAEARANADPTLLPAGARQGVAFRFPKSAAQTLATLDPREAVAIDFLIATPSGAEQVRTAYVEVGDFAAGRAFLASSQR